MPNCSRSTHEFDNYGVQTPIIQTNRSLYSGYQIVHAEVK